jgi:hypothetical protein
MLFLLVEDIRSINDSHCLRDLPLPCRNTANSSFFANSNDDLARSDGDNNLFESQCSTFMGSSTIPAIDKRIGRLECGRERTRAFVVPMEQQ